MVAQCLAHLSVVSGPWGQGIDPRSRQGHISVPGTLSFLKFNGKYIVESHKMIIFYTNLYYNEMCFLGDCTVKQSSGKRRIKGIFPAGG